MKNTMITQLESVIDQIDTQIANIQVAKSHTANSLDRDEVRMLKRAKQESMALLTTLRYINQ